MLRTSDIAARVSRPAHASCFLNLRDFVKQQNKTNTDQPYLVLVALRVRPASDNRVRHLAGRISIHCSATPSISPGGPELARSPPGL